MNRRARTGSVLTQVPRFLVAGLVPLLAVFALTKLGDPPKPKIGEPTTDPLVRLDLGCPGPLPGEEKSSELIAGSLNDGEDQPVQVRTGDSTDTRTLDRPGFGPISAEAASVLTARGDLAPGFIASRVHKTGATWCRAPGSEFWFTGMSASSRHQTVLELNNPDDNPAIVEISLFSKDGDVLAPTLRGVRVPANENLQLDLAKLSPLDAPLAARLITTRGRVAAFAYEKYDDLGRAKVERADNPGGIPRATSYLIGLGDGVGDRQLSIFNPNSASAEISFDMLSARSTYQSVALKSTVVPPRGVVVINAGRGLAKDAGNKALGVVVKSTEPVVAALTSRTEAGTTLAALPDSRSGTQALVVAEQARVLYLGESAASVAVEFRNADGKVVGEEEVPAEQAGLTVVQVPQGTQVVVVTSTERVRAAVALKSGQRLGLEQVRFSDITPAVRLGGPD